MLGEWKSRGCTVELMTPRGLRQFGEVYATLEYSLALRLAEPARVPVGEVVSLHVWNESGNLRLLSGEVLQVHGPFVVVAIVLGQPKASSRQTWPTTGGPARARTIPPRAPATTQPLRPARSGPQRHESRLDYWIGRRVASQLRP